MLGRVLVQLAWAERFQLVELLRTRPTNTVPKAPYGVLAVRR